MAQFSLFGGVLKFIHLLAWVLAYLFLIWPALLNGYPYLYFDSGTYIIAAFTGDIPIDRPVLYSYFLRYSSFGYSLFIALSIQIIIVLHCIWIFLKRVAKLDQAHFALLFVALILGLFSSLSFVSSWLIPDIFSALLFLILLNLFHTKDRIEKGILFFYLLLAIGVHSTDLVLFAVWFPLSYLLYSSNKNWKTLSKNVLLFVLGIGIIPLINYSVKGEFFYSKSSNLFLGGSLFEMGVAQEYLSRNCEEAPEFLCNENGAFEGGSIDFLWMENSPLIDSACLARGGWGRCWEEKNDSMARFVRNLVSDRQSLHYLIPKVLESFDRQWCMMEVDPLAPQGKGSVVYGPLTEHFPADKEYYESAKQFTQDLYFWNLNKMQYVLLILCLILSPVLYVYGKKQNSNMLKLLFFCLLYITFNAFVCGVLSTPVNRYQSRVIWLLPLISLAWIWKLRIDGWLQAKMTRQ